jgi:hypothetical protein
MMLLGRLKHTVEKLGLCIIGLCIQKNANKAALVNNNLQGLFYAQKLVDKYPKDAIVNK